ncbi:MAG TPA: OmpA family protein [Nitrospira sp.]|nr:OmpA family protein [Nitrospira sp.]
MKYRGASQLMLGGIAIVVFTASGCSNMKWFQSGSDDQSMSAEGRSGSESESRSGSDYAQRDGMRNRLDGAQDWHDGTRDGRDGAQEEQYPALGRRDASIEAEGGRLRGLAPLVNGEISGEERLSRSPFGSMLTAHEWDEKWAAEIRREEAAALEVGLKDVFYGYDRYSVSDNDGAASLTTNADWLKENPKALLKISGHCDERGTHDYNLVLGEKRAKAAKNFLVDLGVNAKQVAIVSYGKDRPFCADHDEACHQQNRRGHMLLRK